MQSRSSKVLRRSSSRNFTWTSHSSSSWEHLNLWQLGKGSQENSQSPMEASSVLDFPWTCWPRKVEHSRLSYHHQESNGPRHYKNEAHLELVYEDQWVHLRYEPHVWQLYTLQWRFNPCEFEMQGSKRRVPEAILKLQPRFLSVIIKFI